MRHAWGSRVGMVTLVGVMVLSAGLVLMADRALADKDDKDRDSATGLSGVTQNWDKNLPSASRFTLLSNFGGAAVRDNNTGLVWEQAPDATTRVWEIAAQYCLNKTVGNTVGWRLPSVVELASVQDPSLPPPFVPASVFTGIQQNAYFSATTQADNPLGGAWEVNFFNVGAANGISKGSSLFAWCVRGPMNASAY